MYFGNSGTEAIEAAIKLARYSTGRDNFIAFLALPRAHHGALRLTASKSVQRRGFGPLLPGVTTFPTRIAIAALTARRPIVARWSAPR